MTCMCDDCFVNKAKSFIEEIEQISGYGYGVHTYFKNMKEALQLMSKNIYEEQGGFTGEMLYNNLNINSYMEMILDWCNGWEEPPTDWKQENEGKEGKISYIVGEHYKTYSKFLTYYREWVERPTKDEDEEQEAIEILDQEIPAGFIADSFEDYWSDELEDYTGCMVNFAHHYIVSRAIMENINKGVILTEHEEEEEEEILCGEGDTNIWSPKGCGCVLNIDDANYMDDGRGTAYYCDECYREEEN